MDASSTSSPNEETVSEDSAETADWESVGRELLLQRLQSVEYSLTESFRTAIHKTKQGEDLTAEDHDEMRHALADADELVGLLFELTHEIEEASDE